MAGSLTVFHQAIASIHSGLVLSYGDILRNSLNLNWNTTVFYEEMHSRVVCLCVNHCRLIINWTYFINLCEIGIKMNMTIFTSAKWRRLIIFNKIHLKMCVGITGQEPQFVKPSPWLPHNHVQIHHKPDMQVPYKCNSPKPYDMQYTFVLEVGLFQYNSLKPLMTCNLWSELSSM